jgi:hypothetical protein
MPTKPKGASAETWNYAYYNNNQLAQGLRSKLPVNYSHALDFVKPLAL